MRVTRSLLTHPTVLLRHARNPARGQLARPGASLNRRADPVPPRPSRRRASPFPPSLASGGPGDPAFGNGKYPLESRTFSSCKRFAATIPFYRSCLSTQPPRSSRKTNDPANELPRIDAYVHTTGRLAAGELPRAHAHRRPPVRAAREGDPDESPELPAEDERPGLLGRVRTRDADRARPADPEARAKGRGRDCNRAPTRYQRYSCIHGLGHAYARQFNDFVDPALASCKKLGANEAVDCAQGVFHDYWIAVAGLDGTRRPTGTVTSPRKLCAAQPDRFVRVCWYRALLERPPAGGCTRPPSSSPPVAASPACSSPDA